MTALVQRWRRRLTGPLGRRALLALALAALWSWWAKLPPRPLSAWSVPYAECDAWTTALSQDGSAIVTVSTNRGKVMSGIMGAALGPVRVRDAATGRERLRVLDGVDTPLSRAYLAPDGSWLLTRDSRDGLLLWDTASGRRRAELRPAGEGYTRFRWRPPVYVHPHDETLAVSPDGRVIAGEYPPDRGVQLWDSATGRPLATLDGARWPLAFTPDGRALLTATPGAAAKLWDVATGRELLDLPGQSSAVGAVAVSPDGRRLATGLHPLRLADPTPFDPTAVNLWDAGTGKRVATLDLTELSQNAASLSFGPDGTWLVIRSSHGRELLWDLTAVPPHNRDDLLAFAEYTHQGVRGVNSYQIIFVPHGRGWWMAKDQAIVRAEPSDAAARVVARLNGNGIVRGFPAFAPDGRTIAIPVQYTLPAAERSVRDWVRRIRGPFPGRDPDRQVVQVFDTASGRELAALPPAGSDFGEYVILGFAPDSQTFWTRRPVVSSAGDTWVFEQWSVTPPGTPWWLFGVTACGLLLAAADWRHSRRRAPISVK